MLKCNPTATPMNINEKMKRKDGKEQQMQKKFRSLVGGLIYLTHIRHDIAFGVGIISQFMQEPSKTLGVAKRVLRYIFGTPEYGIWYSKDSKFRLHMYTHSGLGKLIG